MVELELDEITKVYQDEDASVVAVDDVSIEVPDGDFLVLVGPSGCGKSTTLRMIAGLEDVTDGHVRLDGESINDVSAQERDIAMVFQSYALYPHKSVRANMSFGIKQSTDTPNDEVASIVEETAEMMGIEDLLDRKPNELSGGQQQRVALGRAIVRDPEVFLMDEPLSNLDAKLRAEMRTELQHLQEQLGVTTVYVTHDQTEAMTMGDRIAILDRGELQQVGTPLECYHEPANRFVAGFLGEPSMNFFDGEHEAGRVMTDAFEYPLSEELAADIDGVTGIAFGIRPEDIHVAEPEKGGQQFEAEVSVVEPMGNENIIHLRFENPETSAEFVATTEGDPNVARGDRVTVGFPEEAIHLFDRETGEAVKNRTVDFARSGVEPLAK
ncbi:ABC transporter ATP-binding protein [Halostella litorea]|uniref:ABC transporter ATP-binding protein n=1 Tax=Halostella litorea TaxID=2528831 RepID=UPI001092A469|nr:ABC transporter ATP-binding protein [Halostella litorea]